MMNGFELNVNSPVFEEFWEGLNEKLIDCLKELYAGNFSSGEISAKISIDLEKDSELFPAVNEDGEMKQKIYSFSRPVFEHKIVLTLKKKNETKGSYNEKYELRLENGEFMMQPVEKAQLSFFDRQGAGD